MNIIVTTSYNMAVYVTQVMIHHLLDVEDSSLNFLLSTANLTNAHAVNTYES